MYLEGDTASCMLHTLNEGQMSDTISNSRISEVRWHGRGGQGAVTAAHIMAEAAFLHGYQGVTSVPAFGAERRGVPVTASTRFAHRAVRVYSQIETPDVAVVLDETLLSDPIVTEGLKADGWLIVNSSLKPEHLGIAGEFNVATADATRICRELGLTLAGLVLVNTAILGAFSRATGLVGMASIEQALRKKFANSPADVNIEAARRTCSSTNLKLRRQQ